MPTIFSERLRWQFDPPDPVVVVAPAAPVVVDVDELDFDELLHAAATTNGIAPRQIAFQ
jgi:hypothetical protein